MRNRLAVSLIAASLMTSGAAFAQSTTVEGAANGARAGGDVAGPIGAMVGGTVGAAVGAGLEIPNAVITSSEAVGRLLGLSALSPNTGTVIEDLLSSREGLEVGERQVRKDEGFPRQLF